MMRQKPFAILSFVIKPLLRLIGLRIQSRYLRSGFLRLEYGLSALEQKKKLPEARGRYAAEKISLPFAKFEGDFNGKEGLIFLTG
jgi:hypothetical protein